MGVFIPISSSRYCKNIIYSDTVLDLKSLGNNIKVTTLSNVSEFSFNKCLEVIFNSNEDVFFNTIQYSKENKKVYFYTDKELNLDKWNSLSITNYKPLNNKKEILEEIKRVISLEDINDEESVSIYSILKLIDKYYSLIERKKRYYEGVIESNVESKFGGIFVTHGYDYETHEFKCSYAPTLYHDYEDIVFGYDNEELYLKKSNYYFAKDIFSSASSSICNYLKYLNEIKNITEEYKTNIRPINSNFYVDITYNFVSIKDSRRIFPDNFELGWHNYKKDFDYKCNSGNIIDVVKGNGEVIFKNVFLRIKDCPLWMQEELYNIRKNELKNKKINKTRPGIFSRLLKK